jgi:hypothetical protein
MLELGAVAFASPWVLAAAAVLPLVWLLLRITPPALTRLAFPPVALMFDLKPTERTPARTPWWLVALRMLILALVVLGLARPLVNADQAGFAGPLLVIVDNGWAGAVEWSKRLSIARDLVAAAERRDRDVAILTTAPDPDGTAPGSLSFVNARQAAGRLDQVEPRPWPVDRAAAAEAVAGLAVSSGFETVWITDGVDDAGRMPLLDRVRGQGPVSVLRADTAPLVIGMPQRTLTEGGVNRIEVAVRRLAVDGALPGTAHTIRIMDSAAAVLARLTVPLAAGSATGAAAVSLPSELANRIARFDIEGAAEAGAVVLADDRWQRRPVGIVAGATDATATPLLDDAFYLAQALGPSAEVRAGRIADLLSRPLSLIAVASNTRLTEDELRAVEAWVAKGGMLVRFAGPRLTPNEPLLPVKLRQGGRSLGGAMSWGEPMGLGPFPDRSPFKTLVVPDDVKVRTQVLAEPSPDLTEKTWAKLADGTPLVTADRRESGWIVFFHVAATPDWSNLPLSGLFVGMLQSLLDMSQGVADDRVRQNASLAPLATLDGFGRLGPPRPTTVALAADLVERTTPGPTTPPGLYGAADSRTALNLPPALVDSRSIAAWPSGIMTRSFTVLESERDLKPWLLMAALTLCLFDLVIGFVLRGLIPRFAAARGAAAALAFVAALMATLAAAPNPLQAAPTDRPIDPAAAAAVLQTRLGFIASGRADIDRMIELGLVQLTRVLAARTSSEMEQPATIDLTAATLDGDSLAPYPLLYWRVTSDQPLPSAKASAALSQYMRGGGVILFDAPDQVGAVGGDQGNGARMAEIVARLDMPPLTDMAADHVLTRSFYLLEGLPGRYIDGRVFVERGNSANDAVSTVILGGNDWAAAWARDANGLPLYPVMPGGEPQREMAYRAGVNIVMYALTGNYKADQVHIPAIMQRLTQ